MTAETEHKQHQEQEQEIYASVDGTAYPLSAEECIFRTRHTGDKHVMTLQVLKALDLCSRFRTMDGHVQAVMNSDSSLQGREADVRRVIEALHKRGLFVSGHDAVAALARAETAREPAPLSGLFVRTVGRPRALGRLLESMQQNRERHGADIPCYVLDDSRDPEQAATCRELCERSRRDGLRAHWLDREWQRDFVAGLAERAGTEPAVAQWLRGEDAPGKTFTGGRLWNLALLASAGRRMLMLDDDIVPEARRMPGEAGLRFESRDWNVWFHGSAEAATAGGEGLEVDPLAEHERYLGRALGQAFESLSPDRHTLEGLDQRQLQSMDAAAPVVSTVSGTYGDAATGNNFWMYMLRGQSRERFWATRAEYEVNRKTRWLTRTRDGYSFQSLSNLTPVGLDGGVLLPPTLPFGRNEDFLFNVLLHRLHPESRTLEFPWAMGHLPESRRSWAVDALKTPRNENLALFIADSLLNLEDRLPSATPERRLRLCADQVRGLARLPDALLRDRVDEYLLYLRSSMVSTLQRHLADNPKAPVYWAADVRSIIEANGKALTAEGLTRLTDMPDDAPEEEATRWLKSRLERYAALLDAWPALWDAARDHDPLP